MIINTEELISASSVSQNNGVIELELEGKVPDKEALHGKVMFMCSFCESIVIVTGTVEKYKEIPPSKELEQDLFSLLYIRGRSISFTI